jgi:hypothetical protein
VRQLIGVSADLVVSGDRGGQAFAGRVIAIALDEETGRPGVPPTPDATWLLVADDSAPAPVWVSQADVTGQRLGR